MKYFKYAITSILVAMFVVVIVNSAQNWTDNSYEGTHVAATDLQNMENNFACLKSSFSGASSPSDVVAGQFWYDTSNHILKLRNEAGSGYLEVWDLANDRPMGLDIPGAIGGTTPAAGTFTTLTGDVLAIQSNTEGLSGTKTISTDDPQIQFLDPDGADREVRLPAEASNDGRIYVIVNTADASEVLAVKEDSGTTIIGTVGRGKSSIFTCDGTDWKMLSGSGSGGSALPSAPSGAAEIVVAGSTSYAEKTEFKIYIPSNPGVLYGIIRAKTQVGVPITTYWKFVIDGNSSTEISFQSDTYAWRSEISLDCTGIPEGWYSISMQAKLSSGTSSVYLRGWSFRWE